MAKQQDHLQIGANTLYESDSVDGNAGVARCDLAPYPSGAIAKAPLVVAQRPVEAIEPGALDAELSDRLRELGYLD